MDDYDVGKVYEIFNDDYNIKISPININIYENIYTYIDFSNCEKILRQVYHLNDSCILVVYQIEIYDSNEYSLTNNVEYAIFKENKERLNLSVCNEEIIDIYYELNTSLINKTKAKYYSDLEIDVFNIEDDFFNDICYSYSEKESDIILKDRVSDIYQNFSMCENNCKYDDINITKNTVKCKCTVKSLVDSIEEPPNIKTIIRNSFTDSNLGVIKCYKLVFSFENKFKNFGFIIFIVIVIVHIPIFIYYFITNIKNINQFILLQMKKYHYYLLGNNPTKKYRTKKYKINKNKDTREKLYRTGKSFGKIKTNKIKNIKVFEKNFKEKQEDKFKRKNGFLTEKIGSDLKLGNRTKLKSKDCKDRSSILQINYKVINKNIINKKSKPKKLSKKNDYKNVNDKNNLKKYSLIQIDANNSYKNKPLSSNILLDNYEYETAIKYDSRSFWRILYITIIAKQNILNIILFKTPLDLFSLRIILLIFNYSSDLAFNTIFYSNENISRKYHYTGESVFVFSIVNNYIQSLFSSIVGLILRKVFKYLIKTRRYFEVIFREEERKMRQNKKYKVNKRTKIEIFKKIQKLYFKIKLKNIIFIVFEFTFELFFFYFVIAFCEVYQKTQTSWIYDFFTSCLISFIYEIFLSFYIAIIYTISIRYKIRCLYKVIIFFYHIYSEYK